MTRPPRNIRVDPSHVVNTGRIRRDINPGPNSMSPECPGANDDIAVFESRDGNSASGNVARFRSVRKVPPPLPIGADRGSAGHVICRRHDHPPLKRTFARRQLP
jgi:hypothetical protein